MKLEELVKSPNIALMMDNDELSSLGQKLNNEIEQDLQSRAEWEKRNKNANMLALQTMEIKSFPWPGAANIKFPLITIAALQYHARAYPSLISNNEVVKMKVYGPDPDGAKSKKADRISTHMTYQVMEEDEGWEDQMDKTILVQGIAGTAIKKSYFDPIAQHNKSELVMPNDFIVSYFTKSIDVSPRVTHRVFFSDNDIYERVATGVFKDWSDGDAQRTNAQPASNPLTDAKNKAQGVQPTDDDPNNPYEFYECHYWLDLDEDGYKEPYVITMKRDTMQVFRIVARFFKSSVTYQGDKVINIKPEKFFTKYGLIPSPDGGFYDLGFGSLLSPLNESVNTIINQLIDAGTMATTAGGFLGRGVKIKGGEYSFKPMEWKRVDSTGEDLAKAVFPLPVREPSSVLFNLLTMLIQYGERIAGATDIMTGVSPGQNTPAETARTTVEQGMKVFSSIFKRTWRAMKKEFQLLYRLNQLYLQDSKEFQINGMSQVVTPEDYEGDAKDIRPAADPNVVSESEKLHQAQAIMAAASTSPGWNRYEADKRYLKALKVTDIETILPDPKGPNAIKPVTPLPLQVEAAKGEVKEKIEGMKLQDKAQERQQKMMLAVAKLQKDLEESDARILELQARSVKELEEAGGVKTGHAIAMIDAQIGMEHNHKELILKTIDLMKEITNDGERVAGMAKPSGN